MICPKLAGHEIILFCQAVLQRAVCSFAGALASSRLVIRSTLPPLDVISIGPSPYLSWKL